VKKEELALGLTRVFVEQHKLKLSEREVYQIFSNFLLRLYKEENKRESDRQMRDYAENAGMMG